MGFDEEALIVLRLQKNDLLSSAEAIKTELLTNPAILGVGGMSNLPGEQFNQNDLFQESDPSGRVPCSELWVDFDGLKTLGIGLKEGRMFDKSYQQDSAGRNYIVNDIAVQRLGLQNAIGEKLLWDSESGPQEGTLVGIVQDFNYKSLHEPIRPLLIMIGLSSFNNLIIRINTNDVEKTTTHISSVYEKFDQEFSADVSFLDDRLNELYEAERKAFSVFNLFSMIALALAGMGLLGLAYLIITQRTKEIGIRKVLGAHILDIIWMENKSFLKVVGLALLAGIPLSILIMRQWLAEFAYQTPFGSAPFLITITILVAVTMGSVTFAVLNTVLKNPSEALRYE
jgi:putative ABC transport system permease protein